MSQPHANYRNGSLSDYRVRAVRGQWLDLSARASVALDEAWLGRDAGWSKVQGTVPGGPAEWLARVPVWSALGPIAIAAGTRAAINVTANSATTLDLMFFSQNNLEALRDINQDF